MLALQAAAALSVLAIGLARRPAPRAARAAPLRSSRGLADRRRRPRGWRAAAARARPDGAVVEIGSFRGRSTVVLARAAGSVVAIDPHAGSDRGPQEIAAEASRGDADHEAFHANLAAAGVADRVRHVRKFSADAHGDVAGPLSLLYVDGAHRFGPARADLARLGRAGRARRRRCSCTTRSRRSA